MSFLSILKSIGHVSFSVAQKITAVASNPTVEAIVGATPIGAPYLEAVHVLTTLEQLAPQSGVGTAKAAVAVPALQSIFPSASTASIATFISDLIAAMNKFSAANQPPPTPVPGSTGSAG